jgi:hypothetical protein|tara:strand:- start:223 stop:2706 length:2484 start_codon:yes stop_codon:yes gene_type:complete
MAFRDCIAAINKAVGRNIVDEYGEIFEDVDHIIQKHSLSDRVDDVRVAVEAFADRVEEAAFIDKRNAVLNKTKIYKMVDYIKTVWPDRPHYGLEAILVTMQKGARVGGRDSVTNSQQQLFNHYTMGLIADLEENNLHKFFSSGEADRDIWRASHELDKDAPNLDDIMPEAVQIAKFIKKHSEGLRLLYNEHGGNIKKLPGWLIQQTHEATSIYRDKEGWFAYMREHLDWAKSFDDTFSAKEQAALLQNLYTRFASGIHMAAPNAPATGFKGFANIGKKMSHERVLHFKDADAEYNYHKKYGVGKLAEGVIYGMERTTQNIGIMMHLGPNAEANLMEVKNIVLRQIEKEGDPEKLLKNSKEIDHLMRIFWPHITGQDRVPGNHMLADVSSMFRSVQLWSKLGGATLASISDIPFSASEHAANGSSFLSGLASTLKALGNTVPPRERARFFSAVGVMHNGLSSRSTQRLDASAETIGKSAQITKVFFKLNLLTWWTDRLRTGFAEGLSHYLALSSHLSWGELHPDTARMLSQYGINDAKWGALRQAVEVAADGNAYMTPESLDIVDDKVFADMLDKPTPRKIRKLREEIKNQFRSYFHDRATHAAVEPDTKSRGYMFRGTQRGTVERELLNHLMTFKSFTTSVIQKPMARELFGKGAMSIGEALKNGNGEMVGLANLMVWNTMFGYLAMSAKDLAKGREPRDPLSVATFMASAAQGGGFGIYGDFLFGNLKNRYGGSALSTLAGPTAGTFDSIIDVFQGVRDGDPAAAKTFRLLINHTPFINLFYTRWAMDYLILNQMSEHMSPGFLARQKQRMMENTGQTLLLPQTIQ